jgi:hypothetical protein
MINQSILIPMAVKTLTRASDSASIPVIPGTIMSAKTQGTGTLLKVRNNLGIIEDLVVTEAVATVINGTMLFLVTPIVRFGSVSAAKYIRADTVAKFEEAPGGTLLTLLSDDNGQDQGVSLAVTESVATIQGRIDAAIIAGGGSGGGSTQSLAATGTTQGTAAAVTARNVRIISANVANFGIRLDAATVGEFHWIYNATSQQIFIYPATGEFIDPQLVNEPIILGVNESLYLGSTLAAHWSATVGASSIQNVTPSGTIQGGGVIRSGVTQAIVTGSAVGNTAVTLPSATVGARINVNNIGGSAALRLYPAGTDQINAGGAGTFTNLHADSSIELMCNSAGLWVDATSCIKNLFTETIAVKVTGGTVVINDAAAAAIASFGSGIAFSKNLKLNYQAGTATAGGGQVGGLQITANIFNCTTCATMGDSLILAGALNFLWVTNTGAESSYLYAGVGGTMNGVLNGYIIVAPGQVYQLEGIGDGSGAYAFVSTLMYSPAGSYVANNATPPAVVHPIAVVATVTVPFDDVMLSEQCPAVEITNNGANAFSLIPPGGTETINGLSSLYCEVGSTVRVTKIAGGTWIATFDVAGRQSGTAFAGGGQASGTPVIGTAVNVTTVAVANDSYTIQQFTPRMFYFSNNGANACDLFPPTGGDIGGGVNIALSVAAGTEYIVISNDGSTWLAILQ